MRSNSYLGPDDVCHCGNGHGLRRQQETGGYSRKPRALRDLDDLYLGYPDIVELVKPAIAKKIST